MELSNELLRQVAIDVTGSAEVTYQGRNSISAISASSRCAKRSSNFGRTREKPTLDNVKDPEWLLRHSKETTPGAALVELFERYVEEQLFEPTIIYDFPVEVSPLSKNKA